MLGVLVCVAAVRTKRRNRRVNPVPVGGEKTGVSVAAETRKFGPDGPRQTLFVTHRGDPIREKLAANRRAPSKEEAGSEKTRRRRERGGGPLEGKADPRARKAVGPVVTGQAGVARNPLEENGDGQDGESMERSKDRQMGSGYKRRLMRAQKGNG